MSNGLENLDPNTLLDMALPSRNPGSAEDQMIEEAIQKAKLDSVDTFTGAPGNVRMAVGAAQRPADKLATLRQFYPDAEMVESFDPIYGAQRFGNGNFVYSDPETGKLTLFDEYNRLFGMPIPFSLRDLADVGPEIAETGGAIGGAIGGGILGAPGGPPGIAAGIIAGEGLGAATAREAYISALDFLGETVDERTGMEQLLDFGTTGTINAAFGPIVNKVFRGIKGFVGGKARYDNKVNGPTANEAVKMMEDVGITNPTAGQVTANPLIQMTEKALAAMPMSTKIMQDNARQTLDEITRFAATLTYRYGGARTYQQASEGLLEAASAANKRFIAEQDSLYRAVDDFIDPSMKSNGVAISGFVNRYIASAETNALKKTYAPAMEAAANLLKDKAEGKLTYSVLRDFRSSLGADLADPKYRGAMTGADRKLDELYGIITQELDEIVKKAGPEAQEAYKAANNFTREKLKPGAGNIAFVREVINKGKKDATDALDFALSKKGKGGMRLQKLKDEFSPEEWEILSGHMIGELGLPTYARRGATKIKEGAIDATEVLAESNYSPQTFITNYNKLSEEAKQVLFGSDKELFTSLNSFTEVLERIAKDAEAMSNPSGTARLYGAMGMFSPSAIGMAVEAVGKGGAFYDAGFLSIAAAPGMAKLMTNPRFVNWLGEGIEKAAYDPNTLGQHVRRLVQIYQMEPGIRDQVQAIAAGHIGELAEPNPEQDAKNVIEQAPEVANELSFRGVSNREVSDKLIGAQNQNIDVLVDDIQSFDVPTVSDASLAMSPTILPDEKDREIAMRQTPGGIAGLI